MQINFVRLTLCWINDNEKKPSPAFERFGDTLCSNVDKQWRKHASSIKLQSRKGVCVSVGAAISKAHTGKQQLYLQDIFIIHVPRLGSYREEQSIKRKSLQHVEDDTYMNMNHIKRAQRD